MADRFPDISNEFDERAERLIVRALDGEISADEQLELERLIAGSPAVASLYQTYHRLDALSSDALHADFHGASGVLHSVDGSQSTSREDGHWSRSIRVGLATALLAAAAVIVIASLPIQWFDSTAVTNSHTSRDWPDDKTVGPGAPMLVDYQQPVYQPQRLEGDVFRDLIGVQGDDPNVIILFERMTRQSRVETVSGEI